MYAYIDKNDNVIPVSSKDLISMLDNVFGNDRQSKRFNYNNQSGIKENNDILNIKKYGIILNDEAFKYTPGISREEEIKNLIKTLVFKDTSCILVGKPGIGKTSIVRALAYNIRNNNVPNIMKDKKIVQISASSLISGCSYVGMVEQRVEAIVKEFVNDDNLILFIDEIHNVIGAGAGSKSNLDFNVNLSF